MEILFAMILCLSAADCNYTINVVDVLPEICTRDNKPHQFTVGCIIDSKDIYLIPEHAEYYDSWGNSTLWHEILHAKCRCDWHENLL